MTTTPGNQIGPYEVVREIGRGGMGVVYLARDAKLDRHVAIKALPEELLGDEDRLTRFEREAKLLASLSHGNIASVFGLEEVDGQRYLVMEYIEGEDLSARLKRGAIPVDEALEIAVQIAQALEAAHDKSVIHRDLKPANIKLTPDGDVKVLDFGLAKSAGDAPSTNSELANSPTIAGGSPTMPGVILGTAGYLSPEQARGRPVDKRTDIFSFGCVLYEMLTGHPPFPGETATESIGAAMHKEPRLESLPSSTPATVRLLLRRSLAKDRKRRLHDIADARIELIEAINDPTSSSMLLAQTIHESGSALRKSSLGVWATALALVVLTVASTLVISNALNRAPKRKAEHYSIIIPHSSADLASFLPSLAISPDGSTIAFSGLNEDGENQIYLRRRDNPEAVPLSGTLGANVPRISPDGQWVMFTLGGSINKVSIQGGPSTIVADASRTPGFDWVDGDQVVYCTIDNGKSWIVPASGGIPQQFVPDEAMPGKASLLWPDTLPGGRAVLFTMIDFDADEAQSIVVYDMDSGKVKQIVDQGTYARYAQSGHLLYVVGSTLMAVPFDPVTMERTGGPMPIRSNFKVTSIVHASDYAIADDGTFIAINQNQLDTLVPVRVELSGVAKPATQHTQSFFSIRLTQDGAKAIAVISDDAILETSLWILDFKRDMLTLLTPDKGRQFSPVPSPDGQWVYYSQWIDNPLRFDGIYRRRMDGSDNPERLLAFDSQSVDDLYVGLEDISPDGNTLYISHSISSSDRRYGIYTLNLSNVHEENAQLEPLIATTANEQNPDVSPDGRWLAYVSDESSIEQVYICAVDGQGPKVQVSRDGGNSPTWSPEGSTLFYQVGQDRIMHSARILVDENASLPRIGDIAVHFPSKTPNSGFDIYPDGEHFLMLTSGSEGNNEQTEIQVTLDFFQELNQLAPSR